NVISICVLSSDSASVITCSMMSPIILGGLLSLSLRLSSSLKPEDIGMRDTRRVSRKGTKPVGERERGHVEPLPNRARLDAIVGIIEQKQEVFIFKVVFSEIFEGLLYRYLLIPF